MDLDDDDEYMNAAAAHVAFVMTLCSEDVLVITSCTARARHKYSLECAQRDGRPAEYRWRPLFTAAKIG